MEYMPEKDEKDGINTWRGVRLPRTMFEMVETAEVSNWVLPAIVQPQMSPDRRACRKPNCASALLGVLGHLVGAKSAVPYLKIPRQICHFQHNCNQLAVDARLIDSWEDPCGAHQDLKMCKGSI